MNNNTCKYQSFFPHEELTDALQMAAEWLFDEETMNDRVDVLSGSIYYDGDRDGDTGWGVDIYYHDKSNQ